MLDPAGRQQQQVLEGCGLQIRQMLKCPQGSGGSVAGGLFEGLGGRGNGEGFPQYPHPAHPSLETYSWKSPTAQNLVLLRPPPPAGAPDPQSRRVPSPPEAGVSGDEPRSEECPSSPVQARGNGVLRRSRSRVCMSRGEAGRGALAVSTPAATCTVALSTGKRWAAQLPTLD